MRDHDYESEKLIDDPAWKRLAGMLAEQGYSVAGYIHEGETAVLWASKAGYAFVWDNGGELMIGVLGNGVDRAPIPWPDYRSDMTTLYRFLASAQGRAIDWDKNVPD